MLYLSGKKKKKRKRKKGEVKQGTNKHKGRDIPRIILDVARKRSQFNGK